MPSENPFEKELERRRERQSSSSRAFSDAAGKRVANNFLGFPRATGNLLAGGSALIEGAGAKMFGGDFNIGERYRENQESFPASLLRSIPAPTVQGMGAAIRSVPSLFPGGETPGDAYSRNRAAIEESEKATREAHPFAVGAGEVAGDIATLWGGRLPFAKRIAEMEAKIAPKAFDVYFGGAKSAIELEPGLARVADRVVNSPTVRRLGRGVFRSAETGFEAAVLDAMQGDDPLATAGFAAGAQLAGSGALTAVQGLTSGGPMQAGLKLTLAAGAVMGLTQVLKSSTPGGRDRILESAETGYDKVALTLALGATSAMLGTGRMRDTRLAEDMPRIVDAIASTPRGAALSILTRWNDADESEQASIESALNGLMKNPEYRGENETEQAVIRELMTSNPFAEELERRRQ